MPRPPRRLLAGAALAVVSTALAACDDSSGDLQQYLAGDIAGYTVSNADSGALDAGGAASSLPTAAGTTRTALRSARFRAAYSRIFLKGGRAGGDYVILTVYAFQDSAGAQGFVTAERTALDATGTVSLFDVEGVGGSFGFVLSGSTKRGTRDVFCDGALFPRQARAYAVTTCSALPVDGSLAIAVARRQAAHQP